MTEHLLAEFASLTRQVPPLTRRSFVAAAGAAVGFAAAAGPVSAQSVITTDTEGLEAGEVAIETADGGSMPAYYARPEGGEAVPVVLVVQEIFGVHEHIADVCRRLAKLGYFALAPELFFRQGDPREYEDVQRLIGELVSRVPDEQVMADLDTAAAWAGEQGADATRLGITGFCWGGRITWLYATHNPEVDAGVAWYGRLAGEASELTPRHPLDVAGHLHAPVLGLYGEADGGIPVETVEAMRAALEDAASESEILLYADAPHAFHADYRPSYREEPARDGWTRLTRWFEQHLKG